MPSSRSSANPLWDPEHLFNIRNPEHDGDFTCVGWAPSRGRRCWNPIAYQNRTAAKEMLRSLSFIDPREVIASERRTHKLQTIAYYSLCRRYHQNQADKMVTKWIEALEAEQQRRDRSLLNERLQQISDSEETDYTDSDFSRTTSRRSTVRRRQISRREELEDTDSDFSSTSSRSSPPGRLRINRRQEGDDTDFDTSSSSSGSSTARRAAAPARRSVSRRDSVISSQTSSGSSSRHERQSSSRHERQSPSRHERDSSSRHERDSSVPSRRNRTPEVPRQSANRTIVQRPSRPIASPSVEVSPPRRRRAVEVPVEPAEAGDESAPESSTDEPSPASPSCRAHHIARRTIDDECPICRIAMVVTALEELVWCKAVCGRSVHKECYEAWQNHRNSDARCVYCRAAWQAPCEHDTEEPSFPS